jgi:molybdate transport system substrate-binding protein
MEGSHVKRLFAPLLCLSMVLAACSSNSSGSSNDSITVFAASSLTGAFTQMGKDFEAANAGTKVTFNFAASDDLSSQIESEGGADVFASASSKYMDAVSSKVGVTGQVDFAQNKLVVIVPKANPAGIKTFKDIATPGVKLVLAEAGVPVGDYAREALTSAGIDTQAMANVVSNEQDDASVVAKITSGEADAGIVYVSDVTAQVAPTVTAVPVPDAVNVIATYPIAVVKSADDATLGQQFVDYVTSAAGQATLKSFGFLPPPPS